MQHPENRQGPKRRGLSPNHGFFRGYFSFREGIYYIIISYIYTVVKVDGATPKRWRIVRDHDKAIHGSG